MSKSEPLDTPTEESTEATDVPDSLDGTMLATVLKGEVPEGWDPLDPQTWDSEVLELGLLMLLRLTSMYFKAGGNYLDWIVSDENSRWPETQIVVCRAPADHKSNRVASALLAEYGPPKGDS